MENRKEYVWYAVVFVVVIGNEIATFYGVQALTFLPLMALVGIVSIRLFPPKS